MTHDPRTSVTEPQTLQRILQNIGHGLAGLQADYDGVLTVHFH